MLDPGVLVRQLLQPCKVIVQKLKMDDNNGTSSSCMTETGSNNLLIENHENTTISCDLCGVPNPIRGYLCTLRSSRKEQLLELLIRRNEGRYCGSISVPVISTLCHSCGEGVGSLLSLDRRVRRMEKELEDKIQTLINVLRWRKKKAEDQDHRVSDVLVEGPPVYLKDEDSVGEGSIKGECEDDFPDYGDLDYTDGDDEDQYTEGKSPLPEVMVSVGADISTPQDLEFTDDEEIEEEFVSMEITNDAGSIRPTPPPGIDDDNNGHGNIDIDVGVANKQTAEKCKEEAQYEQNPLEEFDLGLGQEETSSPELDSLSEYSSPEYQNEKTDKYNSVDNINVESELGCSSPPSRRSERRSKLAALQKLQYHSSDSSPETSEEENDQDQDESIYSDPDSISDTGTGSIVGEHIVNTNIVGSYYCYLCKKKFKSVDILKKHLQCLTHRTAEKEEHGRVSQPNNGAEMEPATKHNDNQIVNADATERGKRRTGGSRQDNSLLNYVLSSKGPPFVCICGESYNRQVRLHLHIRVVHQKKNAPRCLPCGKTFVAKRSFLHHITTLSHKAKVMNKEGTESLPEDEPKFVCEICGKSFHNRPGYRYHQLYAHTTTADWRDVLVCQTCGKKFRDKHSLESHMHSHSHIRPKICDRCGKQYKNSTGLRHHILSVHELRVDKVPRKNCPHCEKSFKRKATLTNHINQWHGPLGAGGRFHCSQCNEKFKTVQDRTLHERSIHKGLENYKCDYCDKSFPVELFLETHMVTHTGIKLDRYSCQKCGKKFRDSSQLRVHRVIACGDDEEAKKAARMKNANSQRRIRAMKPYKCPECGVGYGQKPQLITHRKREHGVIE